MFMLDWTDYEHLKIQLLRRHLIILLHEACYDRRLFSEIPILRTDVHDYNATIMSSHEIYSEAMLDSMNFS